MLLLLLHVLEILLLDLVVVAIIVVVVVYGVGVAHLYVGVASDDSAHAALLANANVDNLHATPL
jgi:hypothetical protein